MNFTFDINIPMITVFAQGLLSFLSPCVLPIVPLYLGYLAGGNTTGEDGKVQYNRKKAIINSTFFVIGISFTFFLLGFGFTALGQFFNSNRSMFAKISGLIMVFLGLHQLGVFGSSRFFEKERRVNLSFEKWTMGPLPAFLLGFTFSFAWTPCVGPILGSVVLMAGTSGSMTKAAGLIAVYALGFGIPFLAVGVFTSTLLQFFKKYRNVLKYTTKIAAVLMILMGVMTFTGFMNRITSYLSTENDTSNETEVVEETEQTEEIEETDNQETAQADVTPAPDFSLVDQNGTTHTMSEYKGKTVLLNFWATWCPPCRGEMPDLQALYESYGSNGEELIVLGIAGPNMGREGSIEDITDFLSENNYTFPVLMDENGDLFETFGIYSFPTTFMVDTDGNIYGYITGAMTADTMESVVQQTMQK